MHTSIIYIRDERSTSSSTTALTPRSAIMTRSFGDTAKSIVWSQRSSWWTNFVSNYPHQLYFECLLIQYFQGLWILGGGKYLST